MTLTLEGLAAALTYRNVLACLACVKSSESVLADDDRAYRMLFGGELITDLSRHPRRAIQSPWGWTSAAGAYQAMCAVPGKVKTDTWGDFCRDMGTTADEMPFDQHHQDLFAVWCIRRRGALQDAIAGRFDAVVAKCSYEWASWPPGRYGQPTTTLEKLRAVYVAQGGTFADQAPDTQPAAPIVDHSPDPATLPPRTEDKPMAPFIPMLLSAILPAIPELVGLFGSKGEKADRNVKAAQAVVDVTTKALGVVNEQQAIETLAEQPERIAEVKAAVLADPTVAALIEVGGGVKAAREFDIVQQSQPKPFWKTSAVFWMSVLLLPLVYWFVGSVIVGGVDAGESTFLKLFGTSWTGESRAGIANLVIGLVLGGICGVYYGISVTQQRANSTDRNN